MRKNTSTTRTYHIWFMVNFGRLSTERLPEPLLQVLRSVGSVNDQSCVPMGYHLWFSNITARMFWLASKLV